MRALLLPLLFCAALPANALPSHAPVPAPAVDPIFGTWANPKHTLAVKTAPCGADLCGAIVAATPTALQDARDAGVTQLIGTELLREYRKTGSDRWSGTVFIPDMGRSFSSHIVQLSPNTLRISGCLFGGFLCKSQDWTRL